LDGKLRTKVMLMIQTLELRLHVDLLSLDDTIIIVIYYMILDEINDLIIKACVWCGVIILFFI